MFGNQRCVVYLSNNARRFNCGIGGWRGRGEAQSLHLIYFSEKVKCKPLCPMFETIVDFIGLDTHVKYKSIDPQHNVCIFYKFHHCIGIAFIYIYIFFFFAHANSMLLICMSLTCTSIFADTVVNLRRCDRFNLVYLYLCVKVRKLPLGLGSYKISKLFCRL